MKKNLIANAMVFANNQMQKFKLTGEYPSDYVSFECLGQEIINPFFDLSGRYELSLEAAYSYYGRYNMEHFIKESYKKILNKTFWENYILGDYNYDCGKFNLDFEEEEYDVRLVFEFTHYTGDKYYLYAYLDEIGILYIVNDRGENILDYAKEYEWTEQDIKRLKYGPLIKKPLTKQELVDLGFPFLNKLSQTHLEVFIASKENNLYSIEYYGKKEFGHNNEIVFIGSKEDIIEKFA